MGHGPVGETDAQAPGASIEAAVWAFARSRAQDDKAARRIEALITPIHHQLPDWRRLSIATALATSRRISTGLAWLIASDRAEIARPFIKLSPVLDGRLLYELVVRKGRDHARLIARRTGLAPHVVAALRDLDDPVIDRSIELRQKPRVETPSASSKSLWTDHVSTENERLLDALRDGMTGDAAAIIARRIGLIRASADALLSAPRSANLANALKYMGFSIGDAWAAVALLDPSLTCEPEAPGQFRSLYASIDEPACRSLVRQWLLDDLASLCVAMRASNDNAREDAFMASPESILLAGLASGGDAKKVV